MRCAAAMRSPCKEVSLSYKAMLLVGCALTAVHAGDWARYLWKNEQRPQATIIALLCVLVLMLAVKAVGVV